MRYRVITETVVDTATLTDASKTVEAPITDAMQRQSGKLPAIIASRVTKVEEA